MWNEHQLWDYSIQLSRANAAIVFAHKDFFVDLFNEWASQTPPDIYG